MKTLALLKEPKYKCLLGASLIKISESSIMTWGQLNIYFYSYYRNFDEDLQINWTSLFFIIITPPLAIFGLISMMMAQRIGYKLQVLLAQLIYIVGVVFAAFMPNFYLFMVCYLLLQGLSYSLAAFPTLACLWSHFPKQEGRVSGLVLGIFSLAGIIYVVVLTALINPDNEKASLQLIEGKQTYNYFPYDIAENVPYSLFFTSLVMSAFGLFGSLLVSYNHNVEEQQKKTIPMFELPEIVEVNSEKELDKPYPQQDPEIENPAENKEKKKQGFISPEIKEALLNRNFWKMYYGQLSITFGMILFGMNYKKYGLSKQNINDDRYLMVVAIAASVLSALFNVVSGLILDKLKYKVIGCSFAFLAGFIVISIPISIEFGKVGFGIAFVLLSLFERGFLTLTGPGLIRIFGEKLGPQLLPFISTTVFIALILGPCVQWIFLQFLSFDSLLYLAGVFMFTGSFVLSFLNE